MTPSQLAAYLASIVAHDLRLSLMIWGAPGIGKSSIVAQAAADAGLDFIDVRLSQLAPTDLRGLPVPERSTDGSSSGIARWYPPEFLPRAGRGILFLDELNMAAPSMQGVAQQLILDRRVGSYVLPEGWFVWAAGNRKEDRASVFDMPAPLANRFAHLEVVADFASFKEHAIARGMSEQVLSFLAFRPDLLHRMDPTRPAWPSPRSWVMADALTKAGLAVDSAIGAGAAAEFRAYLQVCDAMPDLEAILDGGGDGIPCSEEVSVRYATAIGLALRAHRRQRSRGFPLGARAHGRGVVPHLHAGPRALDDQQGPAEAAGRGAGRRPAVQGVREGHARSDGDGVMLASPTADRRLEASRLRLSASHPFFGSLLLMAPTIVTDGIPTAATDGTRLLFNPDFVAPLTSRQLDGLVIHELLHCALLHAVRRGTREPLLWNIAADIHINGAIRGMAHLDLPPGGVEEPKLAHLSVDEIYALLLNSPKVRSRLKGAFSLRDLAEPEGHGQDAIDRIGAFWADAVQRARVTAAMFGGLGGRPGSGAAAIDRLVDATHAPRLDWRGALWRHVVRTPDDFAGFDRRHLWQGLYVEELDGQGLEVDVCIDTSGSVSDSQFVEFLSELRGILCAYPTVHCRLYYADAVCTGPFDVGADRPLPVAKGGGGTDFRPFFAATLPEAGGAAHAPWSFAGSAESGAPRLAIYLTDGMGAFPERAPDRPVLWVVTPGGIPNEGFPFGEVVRMVSGGQ